MKKFIAGFLSCAMIMSTSLVFGESITKTIEATFGKVKLVVNGQNSDKETLLYNGTTYLPLKDTAEILGMEVGWDGTTSTASLTGPKLVAANNQTTVPTPAPTPTPEDAAAEYSFTSPAPIGKSQTVDVESYSGNHTAEIKVISVIRGAEASKMILEANMFNDEAGTGYEYILAKISVKMTKVSDGKKISISNYDFDSFSFDGKEYTDFTSVVEPEPALDTSLYQGASAEGYAAFRVRTNDTGPKIVYGANYDGTGGIWFKLYN